MVEKPILDEHGEDVSLYFHIPLCRKKCPYCHFYVIPDRPFFQEILAESLRLEWESRKVLLSGKRVRSIYFGGGTPSLFAPRGISKILDCVRKSNLQFADDLEITIEVNPEDAEPSLFQGLLELGVNRLSFGVQSLDDRSLSILGREHGARKAKEAIAQAYQIGFQNISIDLMYDLPDQTESSFRYTLEQVSNLPIQHVSLYNLTIEPHTVFYKKKDALRLPNAEASLRFLHDAIQAFERGGFFRYEISAFAKKGFHSRHNKGYWTGRPFLGLGPSAFSFWEGRRFRNIANLHRYARALQEDVSPVDFSEELPYPRNIQELFAVRLRLKEGASLDAYLGLPSSVMMALDRWEKEGYLIQEDRFIRLSDQGMLFYDAIASDLI